MVLGRFYYFTLIGSVVGRDLPIGRINVSTTVPRHPKVTGIPNRWGRSLSLTHGEKTSRVVSRTRLDKCTDLVLDPVPGPQMTTPSDDREEITTISLHQVVGVVSRPLVKGVTFPASGSPPYTPRATRPFPEGGQ